MRYLRSTPPRVAVVVVSGTTHRIPEVWLVAMTMRMSLPQAVQHWHTQSQMEAACAR